MMRLPPHDMADVLTAAGQLAGQICQSCGQFRQGPMLIAHPDDLAYAKSVANGRPVLAERVCPRGSVMVLDETKLPDILGCPGSARRVNAA